ncbi:hypothetical protein PRIPAC_82011, partial [Pristionchus pacificus]|uniref:Ctg-1-like C-terminal domain-containing protein n=1 Tax=Pristionchus pacificus TaxID=54126 RepID=A0A2A6C223_PRIPA
MCPVLWNDEKHDEFKLQVTRPPHVPREDIIMRPLDTLEKLHVKAGKMKWLEFNLEKGDVLNFHVTGDSSFGFTIVHVDNEEDTTDVYSMRTVFPLFQWIHGPFKVPLEDTVVAPESGLYKVWFSNSRAWFYSVTIRHHFEVIKDQ